jgi:hypothetical protein
MWSCMAFSSQCRNVLDHIHLSKSYPFIKLGGKILGDDEEITLASNVAHQQNVLFEQITPSSMARIRKYNDKSESLTSTNTAPGIEEKISCCRVHRMSSLKMKTAPLSAFNCTVKEVVFNRYSFQRSLYF